MVGLLDDDVEGGAARPQGRDPTSEPGGNVVKSIVRKAWWEMVMNPVENLV